MDADRWLRLLREAEDAWLDTRGAARWDENPLRALIAAETVRERRRDRRQLTTSTPQKPNKPA